MLRQRNKVVIFAFILMILPQFINAGTSVAPMWLTSSYMRAGNQDVIKVLTGPGVNPIYTFTFSSALPGVPNLAYGIRRYRAADWLGAQQFSIVSLNITASTFTVQTITIGPTNLYVLNVPYLAVDPTFPHHLNSFDDVPISYGSQLVNITNKISGMTSYTNVINYTVQTQGRKYTKFGTPLSGNKVVLFMCGLKIWSTFHTNTTMYPINLSVNFSIQSETTYRLSANLSTNDYISELNFSQIIFNYDDVESSKKYVIVYQTWVVTTMGDFLPIPQQFVDNFIMGLTFFSTIDGQCGFEYQWNYTTINGTFGVQILPSIQISGDCGFSKMTSNVFYMKTWQCPQTNPYFNLTTNLCQDFCGLYTYENNTVYQCQPCEFACSKCSNFSYCIQCNSDDHRQIKISWGKRSCGCMNGYYQDSQNQSNTVCLQCIANCITCTTNTTCEVCNQALGQALKADQTCQYCGFGCSSCKQNSTCLTCKATFVLNSTTKKCECPEGTALITETINCVICDPTCLTCGGPTRYQCITCSQNQNRISLKQPNGLYQCICNPFNYVENDNGSSICVQRSKQSCDFGFIYMQSLQICVEICGDGIMFGQYQCDDGNIIDGDGCSKTCKIQQNFTCQVINRTSKCLYTGIINIMNAQSFKNPFGNYLLIKCLLSPIQKFFYSLKWKDGLQILGPNMTVIDGWMDGEWLNINTSYFEDLTGKTLTIKYQSNASQLLTGSSKNAGRRLFDSVFNFELTLRDYELPIDPANNIKPAYLEQSEYRNIQLIQKAFFIIAICIMVLVLISLFTKSIFPILQLILGLQTIFLSLGTVNQLDPMIAGLTELSVIKGFRSYKIYFESLVSSSVINVSNIQAIGYGGSYFGNVNLMIFLTVAFLLGTGAMYLMAKKNLLMQGPFNITKRLLMLVVVFNVMNMSLSTCLIQDFYAFQITMASLMIILTVWQVYDLIRNLKKYYYFDNMFDLNNKRIKYFIGGLIVLRIIQAACIAIFRKQILISSIMLVSLQALFTITVSIIRPYTKKTYNILTILGEWSVFAFLSINLCINLQLVNSQQQQYLASIFHISFNSFVILLFVLCIIYAFMTDYCSKKVAPIKVILGYEDSFKNVNSYDFSKQFDSTNAQSFIQLEENSPIRKASIEEVDWANNKKTKKSNKQTYLGSESPKKRRNNW